MMRKTLMVAGALLATATTALPALAQHRDEGRDEHRFEHRSDGRDFRGSEWRGHGDLRYFRGRDSNHWRAGHWYHGAYGGRMGWWWVVGGAWYLYPRAVYPYPDPYVPPAYAVAPPSAAPTTWYWCEDSGAYYPYVAECASGWRAVPAQPVR